MFKKTTTSMALLIAVIMLVSCQNNQTTNNEPINQDNEESPENNENNEEDTDTSIAQHHNELGLKVMDQLTSDNNNNNIFLSPVSMYMALSMVYNGADNDTKEEIADLLEVEDMPVEDLNEANVSLLKTWQEKTDDDVTFRIANSLWLNDQFSLNGDYQSVIENYFHGETSTIDIQDEQAADRINDWVSEQTDGRIDKVTESPLDEDFVAMLMNAVYFDGKWLYPFEASETTDDIFHLNDDSEVNVPFMHLEEKIGYIKRDDYEGIQLPYGEDGDFSMYMILPDEDGDLSSIHDALENEGATNVMSEMQQTKGTLSIPKFKLDYEKEMTDVLKSLGVKQAFNKEEADFGPMLQEEDSLYISEVTHSTFLEVNEEGTEAAGSTNVGIETTSLPIDEPFDITFDHPFVLMIADEETGAILFLGDIYDVSD